MSQSSPASATPYGRPQEVLAHRDLAGEERVVVRVEVRASRNAARSSLTWSFQIAVVEVLPGGLPGVGDLDRLAVRPPATCRRRSRRRCRAGRRAVARSPTGRCSSDRSRPRSRPCRSCRRSGASRSSGRCRSSSRPACRRASCTVAVLVRRLVEAGLLEQAGLVEQDRRVDRERDADLALAADVVDADRSRPGTGSGRSRFLSMSGAGRATGRGTRSAPPMPTGPTMSGPLPEPIWVARASLAPVVGYGLEASG